MASPCCCPPPPFYHSTTASRPGMTPTRRRLARGLGRVYALSLAVLGLALVLPRTVVSSHPALANAIPAGLMFLVNFPALAYLRRVLPACPVPAIPEARISAAGLADAGLSAREEEIVRLVAHGLGNQEIGQKLFISPKTVKNHMTSIYAKTGARNRVQLANRLLSTGGTTSREPDRFPVSQGGPGFRARLSRGSDAHVAQSLDQAIHQGRDRGVSGLEMLDGILQALPQAGVMGGRAAAVALQDAMDVAVQPLQRVPRGIVDHRGVAQLVAQLDQQTFRLSLSMRGSFVMDDHASGTAVAPGGASFRAFSPAPAARP